MKRLAAGADVLVQNFRPGVVERLGIDEAAIRAVAPAIVYVSINGFGEKGPYARKPVYDPIMQAFSGLTTVQAGSDEQRPRLIRTVLPDKLTAVTAAQAIAAALVGRLKTGKGQHVRLSMLDAVLAFLWASDMGAQTYVGEKVSQRAAASFIDLIYETKNGFMTAAVMTNKEWAALTRALGHPEWLEDPRFTTPALRDQNIDARLQMTQDVLKTRTTEEWLERLEAEQVPCAPVLTRDQVIAHPQIAGQRHPARERPPRSPAGCGRRAPRRGSRRRPWCAAARRAWASTAPRCWPSSACPPTRSPTCAGRASSARNGRIENLRRPPEGRQRGLDPPARSWMHIGNAVLTQRLTCSDP